MNYARCAVSTFVTFVLFACGGKQSDDRLGGTDAGLTGEEVSGGSSSSPSSSSGASTPAPTDDFSDGFENAGGAASCGWKGTGATVTSATVRSGTSACAMCKPDGGFARISIERPAGEGDWDLRFFVFASGPASVSAGVSFLPSPTGTNGAAGRAGSIEGGWTAFGVENVRANPGTTTVEISISGDPCIAVDDVTLVRRK